MLADSRDPGCGSSYEDTQGREVTRVPTAIMAGRRAECVSLSPTATLLHKQKGKSCWGSELRLPQSICGESEIGI
jgi:hypothetical protein